MNDYTETKKLHTDLLPTVMKLTKERDTLRLQIEELENRVTTELAIRNSDIAALRLKLDKAREALKDIASHALAELEDER